MLKVSYNLSPDLNKSLERFENIRKDILSIPLPPSEELRLKREALINRVYLSLSLEGKPIAKTNIVKILTNDFKKKFSKEELEIIRYKKTFDYLYWNWLASSEKITPKVIIILHEFFTYGAVNIRKTDLEQMLSYLQQGQENPLVEAGVAYFLLLSFSPNNPDNQRLARLFTYLLLYKYGYDIRGLLIFEDYWLSDLPDYKQNVERALSTGNLTLWLEYFTKGINTNLEKISSRLKTTSKIGFLPKSFGQLSQRQREILSYLDRPEVNITNKQVQKMFKISQITASRELAKLVFLALIFSHGKGRSVYYTKG